MLKYDYKRRLTIAEIKEHEWMKGPTATPEEVEEELANRRKDIRQKLGSQGDGDSIASMDTNFEEYEEAVKRSIKCNHFSEEEIKESMIKIYDPEYARNTEFFSTFHPQALIGAILSYFSDKIDERLSPNKFKVVLSLTSEQGSIVSFSAEIQKVLAPDADRENLVEGDESSDSDCYYEATNDDEPEPLYCVSFRKKKGPLPDFLQIYKEFRSKCYRLNNANRPSYDA